MKAIELIVLLSQITYYLNCQEIAIYKSALNQVQNDCKYIRKALDVEDSSCKFLISNQVVPPGISIFMNKLKGLDHFSNLAVHDIRDSAAMFDIHHADSTYIYDKLRKIKKGKNKNLIIYFTQIIDGLLMCEIFNYETKNMGVMYRDRSMFGTSVNYVFEINDNGKIKGHLKMTVHNN